MIKKKFDLRGMSCAACAARIETDVQAMTGVYKVDVNILTNSMVIAYNENVVTDQQIIDEIRYSGYDAAVHRTLQERIEDSAREVAVEAAKAENEEPVVITVTRPSGKSTRQERRAIRAIARARKAAEKAETIAAKAELEAQLRAIKEASKVQTEPAKEIAKDMEKERDYIEIKKMEAEEDADKFKIAAERATARLANKTKEKTLSLEVKPAKKAVRIIVNNAVKKEKVQKQTLDQKAMNRVQKEKAKTSKKAYAAKKKAQKIKGKRDAKIAKYRAKNLEFLTPEQERKELKKRIIISFVFLVPLFIISMGHMVGLPLPEFMSPGDMFQQGYGMTVMNLNTLAFFLVQLLLVLPIVYVNRKFFYIGFNMLGKRTPNMDTLIAIGAGAALVFLYFESAAMILTLVTLGKYLESNAKSKTSDAIEKLINLAPKKMTIVRLKKGVLEEMEVNAEDVREGDIVLVKPGEKIGVDGIIIEGETWIDESTITGESVPSSKGFGDHVLAATINQSGFIKFQATKVGENTTLAQIIKLVEEASGSKAPIAKMADKISGVFVPAVIVIALGTMLSWLLSGESVSVAVSFGIAVLVVSCPCALGLATPVAIMVGTGRGAKEGILAKSAEAFENAHKVNTVILDKTGTITEGKPGVTDIRLMGNFSEVKGDKVNWLLTIFASLEKNSEHPLGASIVKEAEARELKLLKVSNFEAIPGKGVVGTIEEIEYFAGNIKLMVDHGFDKEILEQKSDEYAEEGKTPVFLAEKDSILAMVALADMPKETSKGAISALVAMGMEVIMLTGDNEKTANAIKEKVGITKVIADVLPSEKEAVVQEQQKRGRIVAMIGDGINDAPAIARANVGIAIGAATDVAIDSADIVLMKSDLTDGVKAIALSKAVMKNIKQNFFWAFIYNLIGIPLAAGMLYPVFGIALDPMFAAAAMSLSSVCVVTNSLRLKTLDFFKGNVI